MRRKIDRFYHEFISSRGEPEAIAMGIAIGVFVGVTPTIPFHTVLLVFIAFLFRQNITAALLGSWLISNPFTIPIFYISQYALGRYILGGNSGPLILNDFSTVNILNMGWQISCPLLLGGVIMAPCLAVPAYFITRYAIQCMRKKDNSAFSKKSS